MDQTNQPEVSPGLVSGRLDGISVPDLLWMLCRGRTTGVLHLSRDGARKTVYTQDGRLMFASSSDPDDRLGEQLLRDGVIRLDQLEEVLARPASGKRLGTMLVEAGYLTPENLVKGVLRQVQEIVLGLFSWESGEYRFEQGPLPTQEVITLGMTTGEILLQGVRRIRSFGLLRRAVGGLRQIYRLSAGWREALSGLNVSEGEELLLRRLEEGPQSIENLCGEVFLSNFEIYQALWALKVLGVIEEGELSAHAAPEAAVEGEFGRQGLAPMLVRLCRAGETGVLYVSRDAMERTFHIKEGRCVFATSNDIEDGLLAYLLRRGVISLQDREETAKRLLSNKRVGTILRQLGVIDDDDLQVMVREQLSEILFDTLRWDSGSYTFVPGELPTIEEITLDEPLETLVASGLRRVASWTRIYEGCGGFDTRLALTPDYLEVLDGMNIGTEEWEVVTLLREPRTPREICQQAKLDDFRVCQTLWTLRTLGAVEEVVEARLGAEEEQAAAVATPDSPPEPAALEEPEPSKVAEPSTGEDEASEHDEPVADEPEGRQPVEPVEEPQAYDSPVAAGPSEDSSVDVGPLIEPPYEAAAEEPPAAEPQIDGEPAGTGVHEQPGDEIVAVDPEEDMQIGDYSTSLSNILGAETSEEDRAAADEALKADFSDDSPADSTMYIPREQVEAALRGESRAASESSLEIAEPEGQPKPHDTFPGRSAKRVAAEAGQEPAADRAEPEPERAASEGEATGEIPRSQVEAMLEDQAEAWDPPDDLDRQIARFNTRQRILYRTIRAEVGAGAANFVRSCTGQLRGGDDHALAGAELRPDGSWDVESLRRVVCDRRIPNPWSEYLQLIDLEIEMLRNQIGDARAQTLRQQIEDAERAAADA